MANSSSELNRERLPIKLVMPKQGTEKKVPAGGGPSEPFRVVDSSFRDSLSRQITGIEGALAPQIAKLGAAPIRVKLIPQACAKSHRPKNLFSDDSCPVIGAGRLGELFLEATTEGLRNLKEKIETNDKEYMIKEISCLESMEVVTPTFRCNGLSAKELLQRSVRKREGFILKAKLFSLSSSELQERNITDFLEACSKNKIKVNRNGYSNNSNVFVLECKSTDEIEAISKVIGVRSLKGMPSFRTMYPKMHDIKPLPAVPSMAGATGDYPTVVVVDTGISDKIAELKPWIVGRIQSVAPNARNTEHGTFVAGLICWGGIINPSLPHIDKYPCAVFDLQVMPNSDPSRGAIESLSEQELLGTLEQALIAHSNEYKVWNISLGMDSICSLDEFSELAEELDNLQEKYQVTFVISSGNYDSLPLLNYPREGLQISHGRITAPADSVLGVTVGSVSHAAYKNDKLLKFDPSSFSRHGAGPNYIIKPDLVHFGGGSSLDGRSVDGIRSVTEHGTAECIGTSFSAPLVSRTLAQIYHQITPSPSPILAKALLVHHAKDPRGNGRIPDGEENFFGFGVPSTVPYCLECSPYNTTLVFEDALRPGYYLEWDDFPYPPSLHREGRYFGQIRMTLALAPSRGSRWGTEYCETHIDAHFGVYYDKTSRKTGKVKTVLNGLVPPEHKNPGRLYETFQIQQLRKWAPVRTYYGDCGENGERGNRWRLSLRLLTRHNIEYADSFKPQKFALVISIEDNKKKAPVYDEMARILLNRFQSQNLAVRTPTRIRRTT